VSLPTPLAPTTRMSVPVEMQCPSDLVSPVGLPSSNYTTAGTVSPSIAVASFCQYRADSPHASWSLFLERKGRRER
jgi:hypothetical protein